MIYTYTGVKPEYPTLAQANIIWDVLREFGTPPKIFNANSRGNIEMLMMELAERVMGAGGYSEEDWEAQESELADLEDKVAELREELSDLEKIRKGKEVR